MAIEIAEAKKRACFLDCRWVGPFANTFKFCRVHGDLSGTDYHSEVFNFLCVECALFGFEEQFLLTENVQDHPCPVLMFVLVLRKDQYVIHIYNRPSFTDLLCEDLVHVGLEGGWGVAETKEHDIGLEQPVSRRKGCFPAIVRMDAYVVITGPDVDLCEILGIAELCNEGGNQR